jgi:hypothetical protein
MSSKTSAIFVLGFLALGAVSIAPALAQEETLPAGDSRGATPPIDWRHHHHHMHMGRSAYVMRHGVKVPKMYR